MRLYDKDKIAAAIRSDAEQRMQAEQLPLEDEDGCRYTLEQLEKVTGLQLPAGEFIELIFSLKSINVTYLHPDNKDIFIVHL